MPCDVESTTGGTLTRFLDQKRQGVQRAGRTRGAAVIQEQRVQRLANALRERNRSGKNMGAHPKRGIEGCSKKESRNNRNDGSNMHESRHDYREHQRKMSRLLFQSRRAENSGGDREPLLCRRRSKHPLQHRLLRFLHTHCPNSCAEPSYRLRHRQQMHFTAQHLHQRPLNQRTAEMVAQAVKKALETIMNLLVSGEKLSIL